MKVQKHVAILMMLLSSAAAQKTNGPATVQKVTVARANDDLRVEITLSSPVKAYADTAVHPERILVDLPGATCDETIEKIEVNSNGVRRVRAAQHSISPPTARIVLDMDQAHPYTLQSEGNRIVLTVSPRSTSRGAVAPAVSGPLIGIFRRKQDQPARSATDNSAYDALPEPPPPTAAGPGVTTPSVAATPPEPGAFVTSAQTPSSQPANSGNGVAEAGFPSGATAAPSTESQSTSKNDDTAVNDFASTATAPSSTGRSAETVANSRLIVSGADPKLQTVFRVKYVAADVAYLDGGSAAGLKEGMKLEVRDDALPARQGESASAADPRVVAELEIGGVAETSSVADIHTPSGR